MKIVHPAHWLCTAIASLSPLLHAADIDAVQKAAADWAKVRAETVRLETDWAWQRQILGSTNHALDTHVREMEAKRDELLAKTAGDRTELADLDAKNKAARDAIAVADRHFQGIVERLQALRPKLPPRLSQALELPYRSLTNQALTPGERMQYVTTILNRCEQFNKSIISGEEPLTLPGGPEARLVSVLYWGLGQGYALDQRAGKAYLGAPGPQSWTWQENDAAAKPIAELLSIYEEKSAPDFVELPVRITHPAK